MRSIEDLKAAIFDPRYKIVSFDLFDTLLRRSLTKPEHLFTLMQSVLADRGVRADWVEDFADARMIAGRRAVQHAALHGRDDFGLDVIYEIVATLLPDARVHLEQAKAIELELERAFLEPYPVGVQLFQTARSANKRILILSDQYLPRAFLGGILETFGIKGYEHLFLSGEEGLSKASGALYKHVLARLDVAAAEVLHLGDNRHVDVEVARSCGIDAAEIRPSLLNGDGAWHETAAARLAGLGSVATARYLHRRNDALARDARPETIDPVDFLGYTFYGPLLVYVAKWLVDALQTGEVDRVLLLSRDSEGLARVIATLYPEHSGKFEYIYASRRLLVYPSRNLTSIEVERHYRDTINSDCLVHHFIDLLSGRTADFSALKQAFAPGDRLSDEGVKDRFLSDLAAALARNPASALGLRHRERIRDYYRSKTGPSGTIGIFDIGWRGNLQRSLEEIVGTDTRLVGYYIGTIYEAQIAKPFVTSRAFAFDNDYPPEVFDDIAPNIWPLELVFSGTEGSAVDIVRDATGWRPVLEETGTACQTADFAMWIQSGALDFVKDACAWDRDMLLSLASRAQGVAMVRELLSRPAVVDAQTFARFSWAANIDQAEGQSLIARPADRSRKALTEARDASSWPTGFDVLLSAEERRGIKRYRYRVGLDKYVPLDETLDKVIRFVKKKRLTKAH